MRTAGRRLIRWPSVAPLVRVVAPRVPAGELRHIHRLQPWGLDAVLREKYRFAPDHAQLFSSFLLPMLALDPNRRAAAATCMQHPWLRAAGEPDEPVVLDAVTVQEDELTIRRPRARVTSAQPAARDSMYAART